MLKKNLTVINRRFDKKEILKRDHDKWFNKIYGKKSRLTALLSPYNKFVTLRTPHNAQPYTKTTFEEVWKFAEKELTGMSINRFRTSNDYTQELFRAWQICKSNFMPYNTYNDTKMFPLMLRAKEAIKSVYEQSYSLICLNDSIYIKNYESVMQDFHAAFESILPDKSDFEL